MAQFGKTLLKSTDGYELAPVLEVAEYGLIGSILMGDGDSYRAAAAIVAADDFKHQDCRIMWRTMGEALKDGEPWDYLLLLRRLQDNRKQLGIVTPAQLNYFFECMPPAGAEEYWARAVREGSNRRRLDGAGRVLQASAPHTEMPVEEIVDDAKATLALTEQTDTNVRSTFAEDLNDLLEEAKNPIAFGIPGLEDVVAPIFRGTQIVIGGRPGAGKSAFAMQTLIGMAQNGLRCAFLSVEMSKAAVAQRAIAHLGQVPLSRVQHGSVRSADDYARISKAGLAFQKLPISWVPGFGASAEDLLRLAQQTAPSCDVLALDHIQLAGMRSAKDSRRETIDLLSDGMHQLAGEYGIITMLVSQIRRPFGGSKEEREREPTMDDLKESGSLEQDADMVLLLHRPVQAVAPIAKIVFQVAKNRNGMSHVKRLLAFNGSLMTFARFEGDEPDQPDACPTCGQTIAKRPKATEDTKEEPERGRGWIG